MQKRMQLQQNFTFDESLGSKLAKGMQTFLLFISQSEFETLSLPLSLSLYLPGTQTLGLIKSSKSEVLVLVKVDW